LVAFIDKSDNFHLWTVETWKNLCPPLLTCEAVIAESCFLLQNVHGGESAILSLLEAEVIKIPFNLSEDNYLHQISDTFGQLRYRSPKTTTKQR